MDWFFFSIWLIKLLLRTLILGFGFRCQGHLRPKIGNGLVVVVLRNLVSSKACYDIRKAVHQWWHIDWHEQSLISGQKIRPMLMSINAMKEVQKIVPDRPIPMSLLKCKIKSIFQFSPTFPLTVICDKFQQCSPTDLHVSFYIYIFITIKFKLWILLIYLTFEQRGILN